MCWLLLSSATQAAPALVLDPAKASYAAAPYVDYLNDAGTVLNVEAASSSAAFAPASSMESVASGNEINFGFSTTGYWLRMTVESSEPPPADLLLEVGFSSLDYVDVYTHRQGGWIKQSSGDHLPVDERPFAHRNFVFPLHLEGAGSHTIYVHVQSAGTMTIPLRLWRTDAFDRYNQQSYAAFSVYFGILLAMMMYNLLMYLSLRDRNCLIYVFCVIGMAIGQLSISGLGNQFVWPSWPAWGNVALPVGFALAGLFGAMFTRSFLGTAESAPVMDKLLLMFVGLFAMAALSPLFLPYRWTAIYVSLLGASFPFVAVAGGMVCLWRGRAAASYFLMAWTILLVGVSLSGLRNLGLVPTNTFTIYSIMIGSALEVLLLSFAMAERIYVLGRERDQAQKLALDAQFNLVDNLKRSEQELEQRVIERTRELTEANAQLRESEARFRAMADSAPVMIWLADANMQYSWVNRGWTNFTGRTMEQVLGHGWEDSIHPEDHPQVMEEYAKHFRAQTGFRAEYRIRSRGGEYRWIMDVGVARFDEKGNYAGHIGSCIDITEKKEIDDWLWQQANYDELTKLPNRRVFHERLLLEMRKAQRSGTILALLFVDLDRFKEVNDTLGHECGDLLLVEVARRIQACVRETDTVARLGGDEFTVVLPQISDAAHVERVAATLVEKLAESFQLDGHMADVSASIGIALYPNDTADADDLIRMADKSMYAAKSAGRNRYHFFSANDA